MPLPLENLTLVSSFHWVFELSLDKLKTMPQAKFGRRGEGGGTVSVKLLTLNLYPVVSGGITKRDSLPCCQVLKTSLSL